jgi:thymidylate kinase
MNVYLIEGLDRLGKSTLIDGIQHAKGFHQVIHYAKPQILRAYAYEKNDLIAELSADLVKQNMQYRYQYESFRTMFGMVRSAWSHGMKFIMDRAHLGEMVYAPLYRKYSGDYILSLEHEYDVKNNHHAKLILLTEDFEKSKHFADDGLSLGPTSARDKEQQLFLQAFNKSQFRHKQIICVTGDDGNFRSKESILDEALS